MQYRQMVKKVQNYSGFSDRESEEALRFFVTLLAARLELGERTDFASQLPEELENVALAADVNLRFGREDFYQQFMETQDITEAHAKKQIQSAWKTLKDAISGGEIDDIRTQLPKSLATELR
jgi:uncharacterized protein (DUF2267 family)